MDDPCRDFLSRTLTIHRIAREGREPSFIPLYHFHAITNIQKFICNFAREMTFIYFHSSCLYLRDCYPMRFTTLSSYHLIDWWCDVNFFVYLMMIPGFCYSNLTQETSGLELASTITLLLQANWPTKCASHPQHVR